MKKLPAGVTLFLMKGTGTVGQATVAKGELAAAIEKFNEYLKEHKIDMPGAIRGDSI